MSGNAAKPASEIAPTAIVGSVTERGNLTLQSRGCRGPQPDQSN